MPPRFGKSTAETIRTVGMLSAVGFSFVLAVVIGAWIGLTLDRWLDTSPWLFLFLVFLGLIAGILNVYRTVRIAMAPRSERDDQ
jgi:ATP synthase protein I